MHCPFFEADKGPLAQLVEQLTLNQRVAGSTPARLTSNFSRDRDVRGAALDLSLFFGLIVNTLRLQAKRPSILLI